MAYKDFDKFYQEKNREPKVLKFQGALHHLPPSLPTAAMLLFKRYAKAGADAKVNEDDIIRLFTIIFSQKRFNAWTFQPADGYDPMDMDQMMDLLEWASEAYGMSSGSTDPNQTAAPAASG